MASPFGRPPNHPWTAPEMQRSMKFWATTSDRWITVIAGLWILLGVANISMWARSHQRPEYMLVAGVAYIGMAIMYVAIRMLRKPAR